MKQGIVLLVDDDENLLLLTGKVFKSICDEVILCSNAGEALELLKKKTPDVIVSDIMMPEMDGIEFFKRVTQNSRLESTPFLFLTANHNAELANEMIGLGAVDFLSKPYDTRTLRAKVQSLLRLRLKSQHSAHTEQGNLASTPLIDILQLCEEKSFSGRLRLRSQGLEGLFLFSSGVIEKVQLAGHAEEDALDTMMEWTEGSYILEQTRFKVGDDSTDDVELTGELDDVFDDPATKTTESDAEQPAGFYELVESGWVSFHQGDYADAKSLWGQALTHRPDDLRTHHNLRILAKRTV